MWNNQGGFGGGGYDQGGFGGGGDQGGGYMNSPGQFGSPGQSSQGRVRQQKAQTLIPCTVAQLINTTQADDRFMIDDIEVNQVTLVGLVRSVNETATRIDYEIDDMSGPPIEVKQFVDNDENASDEERVKPMMENTYVRVFGHIRAFAGKRTVSAFKIVPIVEMNELTMHLLEVMHSHMSLTTGKNQTNTAHQSHHQTTSNHSNQGGAQTDFTGGDMNGLNPTQAKVYTVIRSATNEQGISIQHICERLRGMPEKAIRDAAEFLSGEGHIYSTIDDDHFKSTDSVD